MKDKSSEVKITIPPSNSQPKDKYPYWAVNRFDDLFFVASKDKAIAIQYWGKFNYVPENALTPLPPGTKIELTVL